MSLLRRKWLLGHTLPGGQWQPLSARAHPAPALFYPSAATRRRWWPALPASSPRCQTEGSADTPPAGAALQRDPAGLENGQTGTLWNSARTTAKSCPRKGKPLHVVQASSAGKRASTCFPQYIYINEQIENCILIVKSFSEHNIEKSLWRKRKIVFFILVYFKPFKLHGSFTKVCVTDYLLVFLH